MNFRWQLWNCIKGADALVHVKSTECNRTSLDGQHSSRLHAPMVTAKDFQQAPPKVTADSRKVEPQSIVTTQQNPDTNSLDNIGQFCIEICSGTAGFTASLRKHGFNNSFGVDHIVKSGCRAPVSRSMLLPILNSSSPGLATRTVFTFILAFPVVQPVGQERFTFQA